MSAVQVLKNVAPQFPGDCVLCGAGSREHVCAACAVALERCEGACPRCAAPDRGGERCGACLRRAPPYESAFAAFTYRFPLDALVQRYKYAGDLATGRWLAARLAERARAEPRPDVIVVPPSTRERLRERGFNPALEIAKRVALELRVRCERSAVIREDHAAPQASLSRAARLRNLRHAFRCRRDMGGLDVVVVDDVVTTGATADAMSRVLREAGAARVRVWAVARTRERGS